MDMTDVLDPEETLAVADALAEAGERLDAGEAVSGPAAKRYMASAHEFNARFHGSFATKSQIKALRTNARLRIFDDPSALLTCNYDPFKALCGTDAPGPRPGPDRDRCTPACANISRTDTHMRRAQAQIDAIDEELADPLLPQPLRHRQQQCRQTRLELIRKHEQSATTPGSPE